MSSISLIVSSLKKGHKTTFISQGNSMFPLIPNNTKTIITPKKFSEIKTYDIVAIKSQNKIIVHQCLFKNSQYLVCQGVNNHFVDPPALPSQILGTIDIGNYWKIINLNYDYELQKIHQLTPNVPILVLKGATWQKKFYGYYLNKSVSDIDILIKKSSFSNLKKTLEKLDYHQLPSSTPSNEISFVKK
ncbi:nucleotidyltransferase family protein, partial [Patescibacteria group bacterium]|nr:nucleotidyltransferase family protein [Patescibacteria group bacterium]